MAAHRISVLIVEQEGILSAQCLEYDIAVQAKTLPDLYYELERTLTGHFVVSAHIGLPPFSQLGSSATEILEDVR